jgi:nucleotide-binding universal stress UspA family protein
VAREFKRILIAVEDAEGDEQAVAAGLDLAGDEQSEVIFVHVVSITGERLVPTHEIARVPEHTTDELLIKCCERAGALGLSATSELLIGYPAKQIALVADDLDVDLIVVGSRRFSSLRRAVLGSTARAIIAETSRPVLAVPLVAERIPVG